MPDESTPPPRADRPGPAAGALRSDPLSTLLHELRNRMQVAELALQRWERTVGVSERIRGEEDQLLARNLRRVLHGIEDSISSAMGDVPSERLGSVTQIVRDCVETLTEAAVARGVTISEEHVGPELRVPSVPLELALFNVLTNAIKYSDPTKAGSFVWVRVDTVGRGCRIEVGDNGTGIAPEHVERVFEPRYRAPGATGTGSGLGLDIARQAVEGLGGTVGLSSRLGEGTTFWLELPPSAAAPARSRGDGPELPSLD